MVSLIEHSCFIIASITMYVPVRPTPAEQWATIGPPSGGLRPDDLRIKERTGSRSPGVPWSGQPDITILIICH